MEQLFNQYTAAFNQLDPQLIAEQYRLPCAISDADGVQTFTDRAALVDKFRRNCARLQQQGYQHAGFKLLSAELLTPNAAVVQVGWRVDMTGAALEFRTLYVCHQIDGRWLLFSAHVYPGSLQA